MAAVVIKRVGDSEIQVRNVGRTTVLLLLLNEEYQSIKVDEVAPELTSNVALTGSRELHLRSL